MVKAKIKVNTFRTSSKPYEPDTAHVLECQQRAANDPNPSTSYTPAQQRKELRELNAELKRIREKIKTTSASNTQLPSQQYTQQNADDGDSWEQDSTRYDLPEPKRSKNFERFNNLWAKQSSLIKEWFCEAFAYGNPNPVLLKPHTIEPVECSCRKLFTKVTVYMRHNGKFA